MGWFTPTTVVVEIDEAHHVTVRKLTYADQQAAISAAVKVNMGAGGVSENIDIDAAALQAQQVRRAVVSWEGPNFEGRPATPENVMLLPPEIVRQIAEAVDQLNTGLSAEEKGPSGEPTSED